MLHQNKRQNGDRGIMVLGILFPNGKIGKNVKQNSEKYKDILSSFVVPARIKIL